MPPSLHRPAVPAREDSPSLGIDLFYLGNLVIPLIYNILIDAKSINPMTLEPGILLGALLIRQWRIKVISVPEFHVVD